MSVALLIELAIKSALICAATLLVLRLMADRSAAERSFIAHLGLALTLVVPVSSLLLPSLHLTSALDRLAETSVPFWLYLPPALMLAAATMVAVFRLVGLRQRASVLVEPAWLGALAHAQRRMGFKSGAALLVSSDITSPVSWGLFRPTIVLDPEAIDAHGEAEAIIAHELAHVARLDWAKLLLARIATALFWFNPLIWALARQCHELREEAADDAVLNHDVDVARYAAILVRSARHECRNHLLAANGVAPGTGSLRRRVTRVLDMQLRRAPAGLGFTTAGFAIALLFAAPLAAINLQTPATPSAQPVLASRPKALALPKSTPVQVAVAVPVAIATPAPLITPAGKATVPAPSASVVEDPAALTKSDAGDHDPRFSSSELMAMAVQGVTPRWLNDMAALGYRDLTVDQIVSMAVQGVTPDYVRQMAATGYRHPNVDQLITMRIHGVTPEFARAVNAYAGQKPNVDWLIAMRLAGRPYVPKPPVTPKPPRRAGAAPEPAAAPAAPARPAKPRPGDGDEADNN